MLFFCFPQGLAGEDALYVPRAGVVYEGEGPQRSVEVLTS